MKTIALTKPLRSRIRAGHPWVYDRAVGKMPEVAAGEVVQVVDADGPVALAYVDPASPIRGRIVSGHDAAWATSQAAVAAARRERDPMLVGCTGRRAIHGEADACPGLVVDVYDTTAVVVTDGPAAAAFWRPLLPAVLEGLQQHMAIEHAYLRERRTKAGTTLLGAPPATVTISEDEARFEVDLLAGQKTGFFLDQRDNRRLVRRHAAGQAVLNLFAYTGGFSIHAALGGASRVTSVDLAAPAVETIARNVAHSGLDLASHELVTGDAFDMLARAAQRGRTWDLVIVDPPSFAPSERARPQALAAYRKLAVAALRVVAPGGRFALASCSSHVTEADLLDQVSQLPEAPSLRLRTAAGGASDHPVLPAFPEGRYLKFLFFDVG